MKSKIPHLADCIPYIEKCGYRYSHRSAFGHYVFSRDNNQFSSPEADLDARLRTVDFSLSEIRHAFTYGW